MLADEHKGFRAAIGQRHHQLLRVPEHDDHPLALGQQRIDVLGPFHPYPNGASQQANRSVADRRHAGKFDLRKQRFHHEAKTVTKLLAYGLWQHTDKSYWRMAYSVWHGLEGLFVRAICYQL